MPAYFVGSSELIDAHFMAEREIVCLSVAHFGFPG